MRYRLDGSVPPAPRDATRPTPERVLVIDEDLGLSGRSADARLGFQRLLAEVTMDHIGLVLGLEMSRLSRSCKDWHHLLEVCGIFGALLADQDGIYDPSDPNDRLLLGLKGQISELELHTIRSRLERQTGTAVERGRSSSRGAAGKSIISSRTQWPASTGRFARPITWP